MFMAFGQDTDDNFIFEHIRSDPKISLATVLIFHIKYFYLKKTTFHENNLFHPENVPPEPRNPGAVAPLTSRSLHHSQCVKFRGGLLWLATVCHPVLKKTGDIIKFAFLFFVNTVE